MEANSPTSLSPPAPEAPVRLKVTYKNPVELLGDFTRSVGEGRLAIESRKNLPKDTRFVLELHAGGVATPVEIQVEVDEAIPLEGGSYMLGLRYDATGDRRGVDTILSRIFAAHPLDKFRKHPRVPLHVRANDHLPDAPHYLLRDLSRGGAGVVVDLPQLPPEIQVGAPFLLEVEIASWRLSLRGEVVWALAPEAMPAPWFHPSFGVGLAPLDVTTGERLEQLLTLTGLPDGRWRTRIHVGAS